MASSISKTRAKLTLIFEREKERKSAARRRIRLRLEAVQNELTTTDEKEIDHYNKEIHELEKVAEEGFTIDENQQ